MVKSLYAKLAMTLLGVFCLLGVSIVIVTQFASDMYQQEVVQKLNRNLARQIVAQKILMQAHRINEKGLKDIFNMLMVVNPSIEVYLLDPAGRILAYSAPPGKVKLDRVDMAPIKSWFEKDVVLPLTGDDPRNPGRKKFLRPRAFRNRARCRDICTLSWAEKFSTASSRTSKAATSCG